MQRHAGLAQRQLSAGTALAAVLASLASRCLTCAATMPLRSLQKEPAQSAVRCSTICTQQERQAHMHAHVMGVRSLRQQDQLP
jgi:hypothetical protein